MIIISILIIILILRRVFIFNVISILSTISVYNIISIYNIIPYSMSSLSPLSSLCSFTFNLTIISILLIFSPLYRVYTDYHPQQPLHSLEPSLFSVIIIHSIISLLSVIIITCFLYILTSASHISTCNYSTLLYNTLQFYIVHYMVLYCTLLYNTLLCYSTPYCIVLCCHIYITVHISTRLNYIILAFYRNRHQNDSILFIRLWSTTE